MVHYNVVSYSEGVTPITDGWCHYTYFDKAGKKVFGVYANPAFPFEGGMAKAYF